MSHIAQSILVPKTKTTSGTPTSASVAGHSLQKSGACDLGALHKSTSIDQYDKLSDALSQVVCTISPDGNEDPHNSGSCMDYWTTFANKEASANIKQNEWMHSFVDACWKVKKPTLNQVVRQGVVDHDNMPPTKGYACDDTCPTGWTRKTDTDADKANLICVAPSDFKTSHRCQRETNFTGVSREHKLEWSKMCNVVWHCEATPLKYKKKYTNCDLKRADGDTKPDLDSRNYDLTGDFDKACDACGLIWNNRVHGVDGEHKNEGYGEFARRCSSLELCPLPCGPHASTCDLKTVYNTGTGKCELTGKCKRNDGINYKQVPNTTYKPYHDCFSNSDGQLVVDSVQMRNTGNFAKIEAALKRT